MRACCPLLLLCLLTAACGDDDDDGPEPTADAGVDAAAGIDAGEDAAVGDPVVVQTSYGPVRGAMRDGVRSFLGIPYAAPPVGERRWQPPEPPEPWDEPREATELGPPCPQKQLLGGNLVEGTSEDCLSLNVWSPEDADGTLPVMLWIHGGGFVTGSNAESLYDGHVLVAGHDVVLVAINYRLGPPGFLSLAGLGEGQGVYGLLDQQAAMRWVRDNIGAFGGDPDAVTIFGESAGSFSVCLHLVSPSSEGLFRSAIMESGSCSFPFSDLEEAQATGEALAAAVGCDDDEDPVACLRDVEANDLVVALEAEEDAAFTETFIWFPAVDGTLLPDQPYTLLEEGRFTAVPTLVGTNTNEATIFARFGYPNLDEAGYEAQVRAQAGDYADEVLAEYPVADFETVEDALAVLITDFFFVCPTRRAARAFEVAGQDVFMYEFAHEIDFPFASGLGAFHGAELLFVWGNPYLGYEMTEEELPLSAEMQARWTRFATTADPNDPAASDWPSWQADARVRAVFEIPLPIVAAEGLREEKCDFWDTVDIFALGQ